MKLKIFTDGGARGNPGPAGIGAVIYDDQNKILVEQKKYIGQTTNNQAEYQALILGLQKAKELKAKQVECFLDSELVVKQLNGQYKVKDQGLAKHFLKIWNLKADFQGVTFKHVPREKNKLADRLVNEAIDERLKG